MPCYHLVYSVVSVIDVEPVAKSARFRGHSRAASVTQQLSEYSDQATASYADDEALNISLRWLCLPLVWRVVLRSVWLRGVVSDKLLFLLC